jgi:hypothetical protein
LDGFDEVVSTLHEFEEVRYPDPVLDGGMVCTINITKAAKASVPAGAATSPFPMPPAYDLCLQEIDELVAALFLAADRNPDAYLRTATLSKEDAKQYLLKENAWLAELWKPRNEGRE